MKKRANGYQKPKQEKSGTKQQTSLRLNPAMDTQVWIVSKLPGNANKNQLIERAIESKLNEEAEKAGIDIKPFVTHQVPGFAACMMFKNDIFIMSENEQRQKDFVLSHKEFFYDDSGKPNVRNLRYLWPNIDEYVALAETSKSARAAWDAMSAVLEAADLPAPHWDPPQPGRRNEGDSNGAGTHR